MNKMKKLYIDGSNLIHRSHWVAKNAKVSSVYLFLASIKKYATKFNSTDIYIMWDDRRDQETANHRRLLIGKTYKGTRDKQKNYDAFKNADHAARIASHLGIINLYPNILEADDIIAWLVREKFPDEQSIIITTDQDMLQLVNENTCVYSPTKDIIIDANNFENTVGVPHEKYIHYKAIIGDKSDNIDGIPGAGPKRALKILEQGVSKQKPEHVDLFERNFKLMSLDWSLSENPDEVKYLNDHHDQAITSREVNMKQFENGCKYFNMVNIMKSMHDWKQMFDNESTNTAINDVVSKLDFSQGFDK